MGVERQQGRPYQRLLFPELEEGQRHGGPGEGGTGAGTTAEQQAPPALDPARALTERLMEEVCQRDNLNRAYRRVKANKGTGRGWDDHRRTGDLVCRAQAGIPGGIARRDV